MGHGVVHLHKGMHVQFGPCHLPTIGAYGPPPPGCGGRIDGGEPTHGGQAKDSFTPSIGAWHYQHEGHILLGLLCLSLGPCLGEVDQLCLCESLTPGITLPLDRSQMQTPLGSCGCFPQMDVHQKQ